MQAAGKAHQTPSAIVDSKLSGVRTRSSVSADPTGRAVHARMRDETRKEKGSLAKASMVAEPGQPGLD